MKKLLVLVLSLALLLTLAACTPDFWRESTSAKPVIYLYPEEKQDETCDAKPVAYLYPQTETEITVRLDYDGELTCTYPAYADGWTVSACPDGTLTDEDGQTYRYLYWEGVTDQVYDFSSGFCVAGSDTAAFLEDALEQLGLSRAEANEFIIYWLPRMQENAYNLIAFQHEAYTESARLTITPEPDTLIRVFMAYRPLEKAVEIAPQTLTAPERPRLLPQTGVLRSNLRFFHHLLRAGEHPEKTARVDQQLGEACACEADRAEQHAREREEGEAAARAAVKAERTGVVAGQHERDHGEQREAVVADGGIDLPMAEVPEELGNIEQNGEDIEGRGRLLPLLPQHGCRAETEARQKPEQADEHPEHRAAEIQRAARDQTRRAEQGKRQILPAGAVDLGIRGVLFQTHRGQREDKQHQNAEGDDRDAAAAGKLRRAEKVSGNGGQDRGVQNADQAELSFHKQSSP